MASPIKALFTSKIDRPIEEVIKVDQTDEEIIRFEIDEYVATDAIAGHYVDILDAYAETPNKPHEGIAVWVSGFFGSGKSSFAKMLGLALENRPIADEKAGNLFGKRTGRDKLQLLLHRINEAIPTHAVIFDVSTDRGIKSGNQTITEIMYRLFLASLGYAKDLDLAELEIGLEVDGRLEEFESAFSQIVGKEWDDRKNMVAFALSEASAAMHAIQPDIYSDKDSWADAHSGKADITPGLLAQRIKELTGRRRPGYTVVFVIDEVGQFVARDVQKMLDLQAVVQQMGVHGRGKQWIVVTSQEQLNELVGGLDDKRVELARLKDRFPDHQQVHLEPSDISEVTSKRVLSKNAAAQAALGEAYEQHRGQLAAHTRLSADISLPELNRQAFVDLYPLLPYHVDLIIQVVSGLRTQGGASKHVGGANRTIIKLAQQLLIHPDVALGEHEVGQLARLDQIYDLVESNITSDIRAKIKQIPTQVPDPSAQTVAKVICLLQFVKSVHRTPENIAAALHPSVDAGSQLEVVKAALRVLEDAQLVRHGDDGYRIPTPAEDDWERQRNGTSPKPADTKRLHREIVSEFWKPQPAHTFHEVKQFKAGLMIDGREEEKGDLTFHLTFAAEGEDFSAAVEEMRTRSQQEEGTIFWVVALNDTIDSATVELYRSREMLSRKSREAKTADETALVSEERGREKRHRGDLQRLLRQAILGGTAYFKGNDRSPSSGNTDVAKAASTILAQVLPEVFTRFDEGAVKSSEAKRGLEELLKAADLQGLPAVFTSLGLLGSQDGKVVIDADCAPLRELFGQIEYDSDHGNKATGRWLVEHFGREPYGWDFEVVRLMVAALLAADKVQIRSAGTTVDSRRAPGAKETLTNNNNFRSASISPKKGIDFAEVAKAAQHFKDTFGNEVREINQSAVAAELRAQMAETEDEVQTARTILVSNQLPGAQIIDAALDHMKTIQRGSEDVVIGEFNNSYQKIKDGIRRAGELNQHLIPAVVQDLEAARRALRNQWPILDDEPDLDQAIRDSAANLGDLLGRETFYRDLADIDACRGAIENEHDRRHEEALQAKTAAYSDAIEQLALTPGWKDMDDDTRSQISSALRAHAEGEENEQASIPQIRSDREACASRLQRAITQVHRVIEGDRMVTVDIRPYFRDGVEDVEQLNAALEGIREECERLIAANKKIILG
jgi:hypothetical protein